MDQILLWALEWKELLPPRQSESELGPVFVFFYLLQTTEWTCFSTSESGSVSVELTVAFSKFYLRTVPT
ncbi:hypothetical protein QYF36_002793 [Acer negundo]|nr:hypothetical protein QYF36_002793 [Acer negundo]